MSWGKNLALAFTLLQTVAFGGTWSLASEPSHTATSRKTFFCWSQSNNTLFCYRAIESSHDRASFLIATFDRRKFAKTATNFLKREKFYSLDCELKSQELPSSHMDTLIDDMLENEGLIGTAQTSGQQNPTQLKIDMKTNAVLFAGNISFSCSLAGERADFAEVLGPKDTVTLLMKLDRSSFQIKTFFKDALLTQESWDHPKMKSKKNASCWCQTFSAADLISQCHRDGSKVYLQGYAELWGYSMLVESFIKLLRSTEVEHAIQLLNLRAQSHGVIERYKAGLIALQTQKSKTPQQELHLAMDGGEKLKSHLLTQLSRVNTELSNSALFQYGYRLDWRDDLLKIILKPLGYAIYKKHIDLAEVSFPDDDQKRLAWIGAKLNSESQYEQLLKAIHRYPGQAPAPLLNFATYLSALHQLSPVTAENEIVFASLMQVVQNAAPESLHESTQKYIVTRQKFWQQLIKYNQLSVRRLRGLGKKELWYSMPAIRKMGMLQAWIKDCDRY